MNLTENIIIFSVYLNGEDDLIKSGDILADARRRYFLSGKKVKDRVFFTSGIDNIRCLYQICSGKPMKWKKEINGKLIEQSVTDAIGNYSIICTDLNGEIKKKIYFSRDNIWQKTEYLKNNLVSKTLTSYSTDGLLTIAVQSNFDHPQILRISQNASNADEKVVASALTSAGEYLFVYKSDITEDHVEHSHDNKIKQKGFFFDKSLMYGGFTTLNIREDNPNKKPTKLTRSANTAAANDNNCGVSQLDNAVCSNKEAKPDKVVKTSTDKEEYYFGSLNDDGERNGNGITLTSNGVATYSGGYEHDMKNGLGVQFFKNGKINHIGKWVDDKKSGFGISFLNDGSISVGNYENDKRRGTFARFTKDGTLSSVTCYKEGMSHGVAITFDGDKGRLVVQKNDSSKTKGYVTILDELGGIIYNGEMQDGKFCGEGKLFDKNGRIEYAGEFKENLPNGSGVLYREDGSFISGEFLNGQIKGEAIHRLNDGKILYKGEFKDGLYNGKGTVYNSDGSFYSAKFKAGQENGEVSVYTQSGELLYKGALVGGEYNGSGTLYKDGEKVYEGNFISGKRNGTGRSYQNNLCEYMGDFEDDSRSGFGIGYKNNLVFYSGFWANNTYNGAGVLHDFDSNLDFAGNFSNGKMNGRINVLENGILKYKCLYDDGKCNYMREYDDSGCVLYEGSSSNFIREGMGCSYTKYGEKIFEGIFKHGEPYKAMRVIPKNLDDLAYCDKLKDTLYINYKKPPEFVSEQPFGKGLYSGSLINGRPEGSGTILYTDHRYTGNFKNGCPIGSGILYFGDGKEISGEFFEKLDTGTRAIEFSDITYFIKSEVGK